MTVPLGPCDLSRSSPVRLQQKALIQDNSTWWLTLMNRAHNHVDGRLQERHCLYWVETERYHSTDNVKRYCKQSRDIGWVRQRDRPAQTVGRIATQYRVWHVDIETCLLHNVCCYSFWWNSKGVLSGCGCGYWSCELIADRTRAPFNSSVVMWQLVPMDSVLFQWPLSYCSDNISIQCK